MIEANGGGNRHLMFALDIGVGTESGHVEGDLSADIKTDAKRRIPFLQGIAAPSSKLEPAIGSPFHTTVERAAAESMSHFSHCRPTVCVICRVSAVIHGQHNTDVRSCNGSGLDEVAVSSDDAGQGERPLLYTVPVDPVSNTLRANSNF